MVVSLITGKRMVEIFSFYEDVINSFEFESIDLIDGKKQFVLLDWFCKSNQSDVDLCKIFF